MTALPIPLLALLLAGSAAAGPIRLGIQVDEEPRDPFLVQVTGHYADFHNGHSRHWKDALMRTGRRRFLGLGPVNPLLNMGVSVAVHHPEYVSARQRSRRSPLLIRPVGFEDFRPQPWREALREGSAFDNGGPERGLGQVLGHLQLFLGAYLPAVDAAPEELRASDASLRRYLPLLDELVAYAESPVALRTPAHGWLARQLENDPAFARNMEQSVREQRAEVRELRRRAGAWLSLPRERRVAVRELMERMRYARDVGEQLLTDHDRAHLGHFLDRHRQDRRDRREPQGVTSWTHPVSRVRYRAQVLRTRETCADLAITVDLTHVVEADLGGMIREVEARFCREADARWSFARR